MIWRHYSFALTPPLIGVIGAAGIQVQDRSPIFRLTRSEKALVLPSHSLTVTQSPAASRKPCLFILPSPLPGQAPPHSNELRKQESEHPKSIACTAATCTSGICILSRHALLLESCARGEKKPLGVEGGKAETRQASGRLQLRALVSRKDGRRWVVSCKLCEGVCWLVSAACGGFGELGREKCWMGGLLFYCPSCRFHAQLGLAVRLGAEEKRETDHSCWIM